MLSKVLCFVGVTIVCCSLAAAQNYNVKTYSVNDGLPSSQIYDVHYNEEGLVWFATAYGLVKFNGYSFQTYNQAHGLRDDLIYDIFEDSEGRFWVSTYSGGVSVFSGDSLIYPENFAALDSMLINYITQSPHTGELWFGTDAHGVMIWNGSKLRNITTEDQLPDNQVWDIAFRENGETWIATMNGAAVYREESGITKTWKLDDGLSGAAVYQVFEASDGTIWLPTSNGITLINDENIETITEIKGKPLNYVYNIAEEDDGTVWIGTQRDGLYWFDGENYTHITKRNGLSSNYIYRLIKAKDGTIWVATDGNGVSIFRDKQFKFYDHTSGLRGSSVYSIFMDDSDRMWIGETGGISSYKDGTFQNYVIPEEIVNDEEIFKIEQLPNGNMLLLTYDYWLIEFNGENFFRSEMNEPLREYFIMDFLVEEDSTIWIAETQGLVKYKDGKYERIKPGGDNEWASFITMLFKDSRGNLWLGTENGVAVKEGSEFIYYSQDDGLNGQSVYDITEDNHGNIWVGTNHGISVIKNTGDDEQDVVIETFENEEVFLSETMLLLVDDNGGVWQGTNGGLNYYDIENWRTTGAMKTMHFPMDDYGLGAEFNANAAVKDKNGSLWFGTTKKGLLQYETTEKPNPTIKNPPKTFIRQVVANGKTVFSQENNSSEKHLHLSSEQNNLEILFGAVNFKDPYRVFYRYKLEGLDKEWTTGFDRRRANYTNLDPGEYTFSVMAKSSTSDWADSPTSISFEIDAPFWQKSWFLILAGALAAGLIFLYIKIHLHIAERKKLKALVDEQTRDIKKALHEKEVLIKEIHHRVKNNLAVISGLLDLQSWQMEEGEAKNALEDSKLRIKTMSTIHEKLYQNEDLTGVNFKEFVEDLVNFISNSLKGMNKNVDVSMKIDVEHLDVNSAIPCGLMLNELISNAYEHAFKEREIGHIYIGFKELGDGYIFKVADDGIGIPSEVLEQDRSSLGITLIQSLSTQLNAEINFAVDNGTTVTLKIPK